MEKQGVAVKRIKKGGHGGVYGGSSWKVAYADFVTAMMAFFLLMWLVTAKNLLDRAQIATYFKDYDVTKGEADIKQKMEKVKKEMTLKIVFQNEQGALPIKPIFIDKNAETAKKIMAEWKNEIQQKLSDVSDQVLLDVTEDGAIQIQLVDKEGAPMFPGGSSELTPLAKKIISVIWDKIKTEDVKIAIKGHTDAYTYSAGQKTNWELSTERASAARKELEVHGLQPSQLIEVSGLADTKPIDKDPYSPVNRRISLLLYYFTPPTSMTPPPPQ
jgi:chemotaxis protein MotB